MDAELIAFIRKYLGVANTGDNPVNKGQCTGLVEVWIDIHRLPHIYGNAKDLLANADPAHYTVTRNTPTDIPQPGAILVWGATWGGGYGHTAVVVAASLMQVVTFEQNDPEGAPPTVMTHDYAGVLGWIAFKV